MLACDSEFFSGFIGSFPFSWNFQPIIDPFLSPFMQACRKLTVVDCPEHGKQQTRIPWADADSPFTAAFEKWIGGLAESFGDAKKAAHFAGVEYVLVRRLLRRAAEEVGT